MLVTRHSALWITFIGLALGFAALHAEPPTAELLKLHVSEAQSYRIYLDEQKSEELKLQPKPIFTWTNLVGEHTQLGHLFVWVRGDRPEVIGTMFSTQASNPRQRTVIHEFHTLSTRQVFPVSPQTNLYDWKPERGITLGACDGAPAVAESASARLTQMRSIARSFSAESRSDDNKKWDLRLLTTPLLHYKPMSADVLEGALFAMVSSAGTDPEIILLIEARHPMADNQSWTWQVAALRFSDKDLIVRRNDQTVWSSLDDRQHKADIKNNYTLIETPDKTYTCYRSRLISELPDAASP